MLMRLLLMAAYLLKAVVLEDFEAVNVQNSNHSGCVVMMMMTL